MFLILNNDYECSKYKNCTSDKNSDDVTLVDTERRSLTGGKNPLTFRRLESVDMSPTSNSTTLGLDSGLDLNLSTYSAGVFDDTTVVRLCFWPVGLGPNISENV